jgi:hypothetical protein
MDPGGGQSLRGSVLTVQCDRSQFSMAQVRTGAEGNRRAGRVQLEKDQFVVGSFWPPLTTIRQDFAAVGRLNIRKLLQKVSGAVAENDKPSVPTELIVRNSTGSPAR